MISYVLYIKKENRAEAPGGFVLLFMCMCVSLLASTCFIFMHHLQGEEVRSSGAEVSCSPVLLDVHSENWTLIWGAACALSCWISQVSHTFFVFCCEVEEQTSLLSFGPFSFGDLKCLGFQVWYLLRVKKIKSLGRIFLWNPWFSLVTILWTFLHIIQLSPGGFNKWKRNY